MLHSPGTLSAIVPIGLDVITRGYADFLMQQVTYR